MSTTAANLGSRSCSNGPFHFRATPAAREDGMLQKAIAPAPNVQHRHIIDPSLGLDLLPGKKLAGCQTTILIPRAADHVPRLVNQNDLTNDRANLANANRESSNGGHLESGDDNRSSDGDDNPDSNDSNDNSANNNDDEGDNHYDNEGDNTNEEHGNYNEFGGSQGNHDHYENIDYKTRDPIGLVISHVVSGIFISSILTTSLLFQSSMNNHLMKMSGRPSIIFKMLDTKGSSRIHMMSSTNITVATASLMLQMYTIFTSQQRGNSAPNRSWILQTQIPQTRQPKHLCQSMPNEIPRGCTSLEEETQHNCSFTLGHGLIFLN